MKNNLRLTLLLALILAINIFPQTQTSSAVSGKLSCALRKQALDKNGGLVPFSTVPHSFDVQNYTLNLDIYKCFLSPYPQTYTAWEIITIKADSTINSIALDADSASLTIDSVALSGVSFTHGNDLLTIKLNKTYNAGEQADIKIYYKHNDVKDGAFNVKNGMVFTDCEPEGARKWYPCWDKPSDKATFNLTAKTPSNVKLGSNGRLADSTKIADTIYYNWISRDPLATYLAVMSAKVNYNLDIVYWHKISNPADSIPIRFYWNTGESSVNLSNIEQKIIPMMTYYSTLFGEHPFEKNGFATLNSDFAWGGMENQTLTSLCPNCWDENLVSHEFAHQWFGDMVTCATWADIWLNEGFATYCESLWYEYTGGTAKYKLSIESTAYEYMSLNPGWPIYNPNWAIITPSEGILFNTAITYDKGACVLAMLRYVLGDQVFFNALKSYASDVNNFKFKASLTTDFINKISSVVGQDMSWFFNEWIYQPNHPAYQNTYYITQFSANSWQVGFTATQTSPYFFKMPIEVKVSFAAGGDTTIRVMNDVNNQLYAFNFTKQPSAVSFDPNSNIVIKTSKLTQVTYVPVELVSFTAEQVNNTVILKWKTASELNNKEFEIERSAINAKYPKERIWELRGAVGGHGTTTETNSYTFKDMAPSSVSYVYRLKQIDYDGTIKYYNEISTGYNPVPEKFLLSQNYPNPFNPSTTISYAVPVNSFVTLKVYDVTGREMKTLVAKQMNAGTYQAQFDASALPSGVYFYKLQAGNYTDMKKALLLK